MSRILVLLVFVSVTACGGDSTEPEDVDFDDDGILNEVDSCPNEAEVVNNVYDGDGCPDTPAEFYNDVRVDAENYWVSVLTGGSVPYRPLTAFVSYTVPIGSPCGVLDVGNAFYCSVDEGVYYDSNFLQIFLDGIGDMAPAFIIAHEIGHHASNILGWVAPSIISVKESELQADCFAGAWTSDADDRSLLEPGDLEEAVAAVLSVGDPDDTWFDPTLHGTDLQRTVAFGIGFDNGAGECTTAEFFSLFPAPPD